jgi:hypothetical protein
MMVGMVINSSDLQPHSQSYDFIKGARIEVKTSFDFVLDFCKDLFYVTGTPHFPYKVDNEEFTALLFHIHKMTNFKLLQQCIC